MATLYVRDGQFWDEDGRTVQLRGINLSGDAKLPYTPDMPSHREEGFWDADSVSFVGRPFPLSDADLHLGRITSWGYNVIRFVITWEAVEHAGPGLHDNEYIEYVLRVLEKCAEHKLLVIMDPHQDVWSRYSGGSGAPYWTYIAAGIDPKQFKSTQAAIVHNTFDAKTDFPRMIWSTNYDRLAAATMFILFFAGKIYAPKAVLDGVNIQEYLQSHFFNAMAFVAKSIEASRSNIRSVVLGWESMNEPSMSWLGRSDLGIIPDSQHLRKGTCPTPFQAMLTGSGFPQQVQVWDFGSTGPKLKGTTLVDPQGSSIWFADRDMDQHYGWQRDKGWQLGKCIWAQHGVWNTDTLQLMRTDYFYRGPNDVIMDDAGFAQHVWLPHFRLFKESIRAQAPSCIIFCQPPVLKIPPIFEEVDRKDQQMVYSPHYYDGLTLMNKTWNTWYNVDVLGVLRGRYRSPVFALRFGLRAIRNCLRDQLCSIKQEGQANLGDYPCLFTEIGIPFDLDHGKAYDTNDFASQIGAMDANNFALEGANVHFTFWHYSVVNTNSRGDFWNGEDLSFITRAKSPTSTAQAAQPENSWSSRAAEAFVRPAAIRIAGVLVSQTFELKTRTFKLCIRCSKAVASGKTPTVIFLPSLHYRDPKVWSEDGRVVIDMMSQRLLWWHSPDKENTLSTLIITGQKAAHGSDSLWC